MVLRECDLVMKGGTTSGVVYPPAIKLIGDAYRLRSVGGSSAGAMAAAIAVAAEYRRQTSPNRDDTSGFAEVAALSDELGADLTRFLQPSKELAPLYDAFITLQLKQQEDDKPTLFQIAKAVLPKLKLYWKKPLRNGALISGGSVVAGIVGIALPLAWG